VFSGGPTEGFRIDPRSRPDHDRLLQSLRDAGHTVSRIVHGWAVDGDSPASGSFTPWDLGYYSLFFLAQAIAAQRFRHSVRLKILTSHVHAVLKGDTVQPEKATLLGLAKVIPQEQQNVRCSSVDVEPAGSAAWQDGAALEALREELHADAGGVVAAHRSGQRFVLGFDALKLPAPTERPARLRERGVYLITGGLGGVTFVLAAYLARTVKARLVLTGRSTLPPPEQWSSWLAAHGEADPVSLRITRAQHLEKLGAEVLVLSADAGDLGQMQTAIAGAEARFGALHGVVHGAGIVGGDTFRPLPQIGRAECEQQFHPKAKGLQVLEQALADRPLDFCLLTSSLSSVLGGFGYGAYAAANLYMDAYTEAHNRRHPVPWLSVNWDEWRLTASGEEGAGGSGLARFAMAPAEGAGAFARILGLRGASQVVVSTGDLERRIGQWIRLEGLRQPGPGEPATRQAPRRHARPNLQNAFVAPSTPVEEKVASIWQDLLGIEKVGIHDNFFELGGHSLLAIQLVTEIRRDLESEISVATLFEGPTVHSLSRLVAPGATEAPVFDQSSERGARRKEESLRRQAQREQSVR
jgi:NAD(P)-dependent dehydrogenase (short-subunit alcohol dehydrogenase family)/acyl carrier protein